jgi:hypothetical protein
VSDFGIARFLNCSDYENHLRMQGILAVVRCPRCQRPGFLGFRASYPDARDRIFANSVSDFRTARFLNGSDYENPFRMQGMLAVARCTRRQRPAFADSVHPIQMRAIGYLFANSVWDLFECSFSEVLRLRETFSEYKS